MRRRQLQAVLAVFLAFIAGAAPWASSGGSRSYEATLTIPPGVAAPLHLDSPGSYSVAVNASSPIEVYVAPCSDIHSPSGLLAARVSGVEAEVRVGPGECLVFSNTAGPTAVNVTVRLEASPGASPLLWASSLALAASAAYLAYRASLPLEEEQVEA
ncbi:MAG: hypothetical protein LRS49_05095 [Desulfurococcales archaeon]|nr:hypothetical protein [Desulfurococcales archaeon]